MLQAWAKPGNLKQWFKESILYGLNAETSRTSAIVDVERRMHASLSPFGVLTVVVSSGVEVNIFWG